MARRPAADFFSTHCDLQRFCRGRRLLLVGAATGMVLQLSSCSASKSNLRSIQDPSFNVDGFRQGRVATAGVALGFGSDIDRATFQNQLAGILAGALENDVGGLRVMPVDVLRSRLGRFRHRQLLEELEETGHLSKAALADLDSAIGADVRYVIVSRIEGERVERHETTTAVPTAVPGSNPEVEEGDPQRSTMRILDVTFLVYELPGRRAVWEGLMHGSHSETVTGHSSRYAGTAYYPPYPAVPRLEWAFQDACRRLTRRLPK